MASTMYIFISDAASELPSSSTKWSGSCRSVFRRKIPKHDMRHVIRAQKTQRLSDLRQRASSIAISYICDTRGT